jgi:hypothetical protein
MSKKYTNKPRIFFSKTDMWCWFWDMDNFRYRHMRAYAKFDQRLADEAQAYCNRLNSRARLGLPS